MEEYLDVLKSISAWYSRHEFIGNPNVLEWLLGRPPTTFETFAHARNWPQARLRQRPRYQ